MTFTGSALACFSSDGWVLRRSPSFGEIEDLALSDIKSHQEKLSSFPLSPPRSLRERNSAGSYASLFRGHLLLDKVNTGLQLRAFGKQLVSNAS